MKYSRTYIVIGLYALLCIWIAYTFISTSGVYLGFDSGDVSFDGSDFKPLTTLFGIVVNGVIGTVVGIFTIVFTSIISCALSLVVRFFIFKEDETRKEAAKIGKLITIACVTLALICIIIDLFKMFFATLISFALVAGFYWLIVCPPVKHDK